MPTFGEKYRKTMPEETSGEGATSFGSRYRAKKEESKTKVDYTPSSLKVTTKDFFGNLFGKTFGKLFKIQDKFDASKLVDVAAKPLVSKITAESDVGKAISFVGRETTTDSVVARIKSLSPEKTYKEAYQKAQESLGDPNTPRFEKFLRNLGNAAPQTAIGVAFSYIPLVGGPLSTIYWSAVSATEQLEKKGKVTSLTNIAIDTIGDRMLGNSIQAMFKAPSKTITNSIIQGFGVEGGTEVAQDVLKYQNNWKMAKTDEEKTAIVEEFKEYIKSGQILETFAIGGIIGAGISGVGAAATGQTTVQPIKLTKQPEKKLVIEKPLEVAQPTISPELQPLAKEAKTIKISSLPERTTAIGMGKEEFNLLAKDIKANGIRVPIIIDKKTGQVLDGQKRAFVAQELGIKEIQAVYVDKTKMTMSDINKLNKRLAQPIGKPTKIAQSIEAKAIEKGLTKGFKGIAEYTPSTIKEQANLLAELTKQTERVERIIEGTEALPSEIKSTAFLRTVASKAMRERNGELLQKIVSSPLASRESEAGSLISLARTKDPNSAFYKMREVNRVLQKESKRKVKKPKQQEISEMKEAIAKKTEKTTKYNWNNFVDEIVC